MNSYLRRLLSAVVLLPILFACNKKETPADSGSMFITPSSLSLSYGQEATLLASGMSDFV